MNPSFAAVLPLLLTVLAAALAGAFAGIRLARVAGIARRILPFSGGLFIGVACFWILPEIAAHYGWLGACSGLAAGFGLLWVVDRYVYSVCPSCSHTHDHEACSRRLHGFAAPLLLASGFHSFFDGWSLVVAQQKGFEDLRLAFVAGIGIHKIPEGLALGALLLSALGSPWRAALGSALAQSAMLAGGALAITLAPRLGDAWIAGFLSAAAGVFVYLGYHAIESEYRRRGVAPAFMPALTGAAGAAALRSFLPGI